MCYGEVLHFGYKEAQSNRMCYKEAQSKRMSLIGERKIFVHPFMYIALRWSAAR